MLMLNLNCRTGLICSIQTENIPLPHVHILGGLLGIEFPLLHPNRVLVNIIFLTFLGCVSSPRPSHGAEKTFTCMCNVRPFTPPLRPGSLQTCCDCGDGDTMKSPWSRWAFFLGFLVGGCSIYFFLRQVWFERSYPVLSEAQEKAPGAGRRRASWRREGAALVNLLHPHHEGAAPPRHTGAEEHSVIQEGGLLLVCWL